VLTVDPTTHHLLWANNAAAERGSSFPAQPAYGNNVPFFRTDLGEWYYYDGTRWLSCTIYTSTPVLNNATVPPWSLNTDLAMAWPVNTVGTARGIYVMGWAATTYVATPNNGLNFWTVTLFLDGSAASQFTTASDTAGAQTVHINAVVAAYAAGGQRLLINITKTGSPGVLYSPLFVEYRKIAT
jgi:hypothetical protein